MANFVKLDAGILNSTLWGDRDAREIFITALLMCRPYELTQPMDQLEVRSLEPTGWVVPVGWYGFAPAAGIGIVRQAGLATEAGLDALERLGTTDAESRSKDFGGRRLVRVDGGYVALNYVKHWDRDMTAADRMRRFRERKKAARNVNDVTRNITHGDGERDGDGDISHPHAVLRSSRAHEDEDPIGQAPPETGTPVGVGALAPADLSAALRPLWLEIAKDHGHEVATKARDATKRLFGAATPARMRETFAAAYERKALALPAELWPDFRTSMRNDRAGLQSTAAEPIDPERAAARQRHLDRIAKEDRHVAG